MSAGTDLFAFILAVEYNLVPFERTMYEYWLLEENGEEHGPNWKPSDMVFRIANSDEPTNIHILLDTTELIG